MKIQKFKIAILLLNQSLISAVPWGPKTALTGEFLYTESSAMRTSSHHWADDKQSKARNSDSKYRKMALVGFDT